MDTTKQGTLSIESKNVFSILKRWLYSEQDIVFRELVSNAMDAIEKLRLIHPETQGLVTVRLDEETRLLTISDNGIGMSASEVNKYINQIAFSGAEDFIRKNSEAGNNIIGHFGVGFYSAFMLSEHVAIETMNHEENAAPVRWDCTADMSYTMGPGNRASAGTDVILHLSEDNPYIKKPSLAYEAIKKYFVFAETPVIFCAKEYDNVQVNTPAPLWKQPEDATNTEEMEAFYKEYFGDSSAPLFWFQFASLDLGLRGILYFRNTKNNTDELDGTVKVYCRGVYVGENIKGLIPKFVNLQNGIIECDQLPLVVSRGDLRSGEEQTQGDVIALVNECLAQEVTIALNDMFTNRRSQFEEYWPELNAFVKYAVLQDKTFASVMTRKIIFEDIYGKYHTIPEYIENSEPQSTVLYASDKLDQAHYIEILRKLTYNALLFDHVIDQPLLYKYETVYPKIQFIRIDSNAVGVYHGALQPGDETLTHTLQKKLSEALGERMGHIFLQFSRMGSKDVSALIVNDEQSRRLADMMEIYGLFNPNNTDEKEKQSQSSLLLNLNNSTVQFLSTTKDKAAFSTVANQLFDLALLSQQLLKPEDMEPFINRSENMLKMYIQNSDS